MVSFDLRAIGARNCQRATGPFGVGGTIGGLSRLRGTKPWDPGGGDRARSRQGAAELSGPAEPSGASGGSGPAEPSGSSGADCGTPPPTVPGTSGGPASGAGFGGAPYPVRPEAGG